MPKKITPKNKAISAARTGEIIGWGVAGGTDVGAVVLSLCACAMVVGAGVSVGTGVAVCVGATVAVGKGAVAVGTAPVPTAARTGCVAVSDFAESCADRVGDASVEEDDAAGGGTLVGAANGAGGGAADKAADDDAPAALGACVACGAALRTGALVGAGI